MKDKFTLPQTTSTSWREAYTIKNLPSYTPPNSVKEIDFILDNIKIAGGQSVYNGEYPFNGKWSNTAINEKTQIITVSGFLRGEKYIEKRNELVEALRIETNDDNAGYLFLPLWGRLKVVVLGWSVDESVNENGQCKIEINLNRVGESETERLKSLDYVNTVIEDANALKNNSVLSLSEKLKQNFDANTFISSIKIGMSKLENIIARIQGNASEINNMVKSVNALTALIAQGVKTPAIIAEAFSNIAGSIANGVIQIKQSAYQSRDSVKSSYSNIASYFSVSSSSDKNEVKALVALSNTSSLDFTNENMISIKQVHTATETANFIKLIAIYTMSLILEDGSETKDKLKNYLALYEKLFNSIDLNDSSIYSSVLTLKLSTISSLENKNLESVKNIEFNKTQTLLYAQKYLACEKLRELNNIEDSFNIDRKINYV